MSKRSPRIPRGEVPFKRARSKKKTTLDDVDDALRTQIRNAAEELRTYAQSIESEAEFLRSTYPRVFANEKKGEAPLWGVLRQLRELSETAANAYPAAAGQVQRHRALRALAERHSREEVAQLVEAAAGPVTRKQHQRALQYRAIDSLAAAQDALAEANVALMGLVVEGSESGHPYRRRKGRPTNDGDLLFAIGAVTAGLRKGVVITPKQLRALAEESIGRFQPSLSWKRVLGRARRVIGEHAIEMIRARDALRKATNQDNKSTQDAI